MGEDLLEAVRMPCFLPVEICRDLQLAGIHSLEARMMNVLLYLQD
jgi:hypothetical protein